MGSPHRVLLATLLVSLPFAALGQQEAALAYTPSVAACPPGTQLVRLAGTTHQTLSADEDAYIGKRESRVTPVAWASYLANVHASAKRANTSLPLYVDAILGSHLPAVLPRLAITASGGGYRAAIFGAGTLSALDARNTTSAHAGTGGLLQSASYLGGLSGGSWLVSSLVQANFPMLPDLIFGGSNVAGLENATGSIGDVNAGWNPGMDLLEPDSQAAAFIELLLGEIAGKAEAGFPVTVTDLWSRSLARHFCNGTTAANFFNPNLTHGAGITLSGLINVPSFKQHAIPLPIFVVDSKSKFQNNTEIIPGDDIPLTNPVYEFTPFETGSYDPILGAFTPTKFLGSQNGQCTTGFDQLSIVAGASSNIFNGFNFSATSVALSEIEPLIVALNEFFPEPNVELDAAAVPNPFFGVAPKTFIDSNQTLLALVDGGSDGEVSPLQPMLVKARGIDTIFVIDASADTPESFSNGSSLIATKERVALFPQSYSFPPIPSSPDTFVSEGLTKRPTFFGCNHDSEGKGSHFTSDAPLIIYLANGAAPLGQTPLTNFSTDIDTFTNGQISGVLAQVFDVATQGMAINGTEKDPEWPVCLACGIVDRARARLGAKRTGVCAQCLERYCWS